MAKVCTRNNTRIPLRFSFGGLRPQKKRRIVPPTETPI